MIDQYDSVEKEFGKPLSVKTFQRILKKKMVLEAI